MNRRSFLKSAGQGAVALTLGGQAMAFAQGQKAGDRGKLIEGFYPANIVHLNDGSLVTEGGQQSTDGGRTWRPSETFKSVGGLGLLRLPNGELGTYYADKWTMETALGNDTNNWFFRWSADEGKSWSDPVQITLPGLTMGLTGTMFALRDGRLLLPTYSQFIGSRFDKRGASWGTYKGVRFQTETEAHYPQFEVGRVYYSDDNGRTWKPSDGWIIGWRDSKWSDSFTEPCGLELKDGRVILMGRSDRGRLHQAFSEDRAHSWWPGAKQTTLAASYSPCRIARLPRTDDLLVVWNQLSRAETRKGFRRSRLSCAVSTDEGQKWGHLKNIEAIKCLSGKFHIPPSPDFAPVWGDDEVGELPDDFSIFHYPSLNVVGEEVFVSYAFNEYTTGKDSEGKPVVQQRGSPRTRILNVDWFYH